MMNKKFPENGKYKSIDLGAALLCEPANTK
jgi:hypothetical protein